MKTVAHSSRAPSRPSSHASPRTTVGTVRTARTSERAPQPTRKEASISQRLLASLTQQRAAHLLDPMPSHAQRLQDLDALAQFVQDHQDAICQAISADYGHRSRHETLLTDIAPVLSGIRHAKAHLKAWMRPQRREVDRLTFGLAANRVIPQPLGVVGVIVPWNFPLNLSLVPLTYIFAAGNRAMVKMSENSRHLAALLIKTMPAYFPPEKLQFFDETGGKNSSNSSATRGVGPAFSKLPFDHLVFTGSSQTGRAVMAACAANLTPVTLELGGRSPAIVCDDFDLRTAAERMLFVKYLNAGQICTTVDHAYLPEKRIDDFVDLAREIMPERYASLASKDYSSIIDRTSYERLKATLDDARSRGAKVIPLLPGKAFDARQHRIAPHLVLGAADDSLLLQREIFGPILPLLPYRQLGEVIQRINAGPKPLAIYPFSKSSRTVNHIVEQVMSGGVSVNDALMHVGQDDLPFGGVGESGMGHYHGHEGFATFSKLRPVFEQARWSSVSLLVPPYGKVAEGLLKFLTR
jgi:coniferyl-aldehyde dehydrogenase